MRLSIMQPYFFPYIGYFQLIKAVDKFVFYDDVNFIKNGWINRNRILVNDKPNYLTVQLNEASPFKLINQIVFNDNRPKLVKTVQMAYKRAPYYNSAWPVINDCLTYKTNNISELAMKSVSNISEYLNLKTIFEISSISYPETKGLEKVSRLVEICKTNNAQTYINVVAGMGLYNKEQFKEMGIELCFIKANDIEYTQYHSNFVPWLSIIDIIMFNPIERVEQYLDNYQLI